MIFMVCSTIAGAFGGILMKLSHNVSSEVPLLQETPEQQTRRKRVSWAYFVLGVVVCNGCLNVGLSAAALACAAQSLLSPFVACQIVFNAVLSTCLLSERFTNCEVRTVRLAVEEREDGTGRYVISRAEDEPPP